MEESTNLNPTVSLAAGISPLELKAAQEVTQAFLMAVKNYGLFPAEHVSTLNMLRSLCANLNGFIDRYGPLRLNIEKSRLRYEEEILFEESDPDSNPAFMFFRDGLLWLEFLPGLEPHEIQAFFRIVSRYKLPQEDPEGDLVTELWSAELEHINYGASESLWEAEPVLEFSLLNPEAQAVLDYGGGAAVAGFDLLKSVLGLGGGLEDAPNKAGGGGGAGTAAGVDSGSGPASGEGLGGNAPGGAVPATGAGPGSPEPGLESVRAGGLPAGSGALAAPGARAEEEDPDGLDFWAALRRVSPSAPAGERATDQRPGQSGLPGEVPGGAAGAGASAGRQGGAPAATSRGGGGKVVFAAGRAGGSAGGVTRPEPLARDLRRQGGSSDPALGQGSGSAEVAARKATAFSRPGRGGDWGEDGSDQENYISVNVASIEPGHSLWQFSAEEQQSLQQMVRQYEEGDNSADIIELLLLLLQMEEEPQIAIAMLAFLKEEFRLTLTNRGFRSGHNLLVKADELLRELPPDQEWLRPLLGQFFEDIAEPEVLDAMLPVWSELATMKPDAVHDFASILRLLPPRAGESLVPLVSQVQAGPGRRTLIDLIAVFAGRDLAVLEKILDRPEEDLILRLVHILREVPDRPRAEQLLGKVIKHPKEKVRQEVCDILIAWETSRYDRIFQLLHDPCPAIRARAFEYLGRERNREVEALLAAHIASDRFLLENQEQVANCYLALGLCGSDASLPLLQRILFGQPWNFLVGIGTRVHRQGAAIALGKLRTKGSRKLLAEAEASTIPHIRAAWQKAAGN